MPSRPEQSPAEARTAGLILAAGGSRRLGRPKQLLPYGSGVLLDAVLATARDCGFEQTILALGGAAAEVQSTADTSGCDIVVNPDFGEGCSSSIATGLAVLHPDTDAVVLLLGDQPGVRAATVRALLSALLAERKPGSPEQGSGDRPGPGIAVCRYDDGLGHPIAFAREFLPGLSVLHGDKAVWKLLEQRADDVVELAVAGPVPLDVDTEEDYRQVMAELDGVK
ncbi:Nicotine blue oxidoreductase [Arthrobacter sp. SO5]|uniref:nucleotidyltransferase family protein n=1 Tax=Arthrobacter sp. SO5 TaxID=1897055 RepID=UPI001E52CF7A|nr:nucleotidyltransferase family protein [Arthrobacter sp. SO5]MCB5273355.1 Nicotine blue oxidoreductase [Arthrobacter sp. SO5]